MLKTTTELMRNAKATNAFCMPASTFALQLQRNRNSAPKAINPASQQKITDAKEGPMAWARRSALMKVAI